MDFFLLNYDYNDCVIFVFKNYKVFDNSIISNRIKMLKVYKKQSIIFGTKIYVRKNTTH